MVQKILIAPIGKKLFVPFRPGTYFLWPLHKSMFPKFPNTVLTKSKFDASVVATLSLNTKMDVANLECNLKTIGQKQILLTCIGK